MIRFVRAVVTCSFFLGTAACQKPSVPSSQFNQDLKRLKGLVIPLESRGIANPEPILSNSTFRAEWEFETDLTKERYEAWVKKGLATEFKSATKTDGLVFTRYSGHDSQSVEITSVAKSGKLRVHAVFLSYPD